jgi:hypothetical protein
VVLYGVAVRWCTIEVVGTIARRACVGVFGSRGLYAIGKSGWWWHVVEAGEVVEWVRDGLLRRTLVEIATGLSLRCHEISGESGSFSVGGRQE